MNYDLAKQLKYVGYKFTECSVIYDECDNKVFNFEDEFYKALHYPTLSELIEACGDDFLSLDSPRVDHIGEWYAVGTIGENQLYREANGSTPEEAVAKLYLEIRKLSTLSLDTDTKLE